MLLGAVKNYLNNLKVFKKDLFYTSNLLRILGMLNKKIYVGPLKVNIDITNKCDMQCVMCWYHSPYIRNKKNKNEFHISLDKFKEIINDLKNLHTKIILLCGEGEPFLHPQIFRIIEIIRKNNMEVEIMTNCYHLNEVQIKYLAKFRIKKILVSLHAATPYTFKRIRPNRNDVDFYKIINNIKFLKKTSATKIYLINVISSLNIREIPKMLQLGNKLKIDRIVFKPLVLSEELPSSLKIPLRIKKDFVKTKNTYTIYNVSNNINKYIKHLLTSNLTLNKRKITKVEKILPCYIPWTLSTIDLNGNVIGCVYSKKLLGNIYKDTFSSIWFGKEYSIFRRGNFCPQRCLGKIVYPSL